VNDDETLLTTYKDSVARLRKALNAIKRTNSEYTPSIGQLIANVDSPGSYDPALEPVPPVREDYTSDELYSDAYETYLESVLGINDSVWVDNFAIPIEPIQLKNQISKYSPVRFTNNTMFKILRETERGLEINMESQAFAILDENLAENVYGDTPTTINIKAAKFPVPSGTVITFPTAKPTDGFDTNNQLEEVSYATLDKPVAAGDTSIQVVNGQIYEEVFEGSRIFAQGVQLTSNILIGLQTLQAEFSSFYSKTLLGYLWLTLQNDTPIISICLVKSSFNPDNEGASPLEQIQLSKGDTLQISHLGQVAMFTVASDYDVTDRVHVIPVEETTLENQFTATLTSDGLLSNPKVYSTINTSNSLIKQTADSILLQVSELFGDDVLGVVASAQDGDIFFTTPPSVDLPQGRYFVWTGRYFYSIDINSPIPANQSTATYDTLDSTRFSPDLTVEENTGGMLLRSMQLSSSQLQILSDQIRATVSEISQLATIQSVDTTTQTVTLSTGLNRSLQDGDQVRLVVSGGLTGYNVTLSGNSTVVSQGATSFKYNQATANLSVGQADSLAGGSVVMNASSQFNQLADLIELNLVRNDEIIAAINLSNETNADGSVIRISADKIAIGSGETITTRFKCAASAPTQPGANDTLADLDAAGWQQEIPGGCTDIIWATFAVFNLKDEKLTAWSLPREYGGLPGPAGQEGMRYRELTAYRASNIELNTAPTGGSFQFGAAGAGVFTPPTDWFSTPTAARAAAPELATAQVYISTTVANGFTGDTDGLTPNEFTWSAPTPLTSDGSSVNQVFTRSATAPSKPANTTEASPIPSIANGSDEDWFDTVGETSGTDRLWASVGTKAVNSNTWVWNEPFPVEGIEGPPGPGGAPARRYKEITLYRTAWGTLTNTNLPTATTYTFDDSAGDTLNIPAGDAPWRSTIAAAVVDNPNTPIWVTTSVADGFNGTTDTNLSWSTPSIISSTGTEVNQIFTRASSAPAKPANTDTDNLPISRG